MSLLHNKYAIVLTNYIFISYFLQDDFRCKLSGCPCRLPERTLNDVVLDSLEEIKISNYGEAYHTVELVGLLCEYSAIFQERLVITVSNCGQKILCIIHPREGKVEITHL